MSIISNPLYMDRLRASCGYRMGVAKVLTYPRILAADEDRMPEAENDVASLVRIKAARDAAMASRQAWEARKPVAADQNQLRSLARSRWPTCIALMRSLAASYQERSGDLGILIEVEEVVRLRTSLPELAIHLVRTDGKSGTDLLFRMARDGCTFCKIQQTKGSRRENLNRAEFSMLLSEQNLRVLLRTVVHILVSH